MHFKLIILIAALFVNVCTFAKDLHVAVFTTNPPMHCSSCENRIKENIKFEKGIKKIDTDIKTQTVTIKYDADAIGADAIKKAFKKIGFDVNLASDTAIPSKNRKK